MRGFITLPKSNDITRLYEGQVQLLYANAAISMIATVVNSIILTCFLWKVILPTILTTWLVSNIVITLIRYVMVYKYNHATVKSKQEGHWGMLLIFGIACSGIVWGCAGIFMFAPDSIIHQVFLVFVIGGMMAGSLGAYSVVLPAFLVFCIPISTPIIIRFILIGSEAYVLMAVMMILFTIIVTITARRMNITIIKSLKLQFENKDLIVSLTEAKGRAENLNKELSLKITEIEQTDKAFRESEKRLQLISDSMLAGFIIIDADTHTITDINPAACAMIGASKNFILGSVCHEYICPTQKGACPITDLGQAVDHSERLLQRADGSKMQVLKSVTEIKLCGKAYLLESFVDITDRKRAEKEREKLISELQDSLAKINTLSGLVPICSKCKKVRDDKGYWSQVEDYVHAHSNAEFSHSLCPECVEKLYPDFYKRKEKDGKKVIPQS